MNWLNWSVALVVCGYNLNEPGYLVGHWHGKSFVVSWVYIKNKERAVEHCNVASAAVITCCHDWCWFSKPLRDWQIHISSNLICGEKQGLPSPESSYFFSFLSLSSKHFVFLWGSNCHCLFYTYRLDNKTSAQLGILATQYLFYFSLVLIY